MYDSSLFELSFNSKHSFGMHNSINIVTQKAMESNQMTPLNEFHDDLQSTLLGCLKSSGRLNIGMVIRSLMTFPVPLSCPAVEINQGYSI